MPSFRLSNVVKGVLAGSVCLGADMATRALGGDGGGAPTWLPLVAVGGQISVELVAARLDEAVKKGFRPHEFLHQSFLPDAVGESIRRVIEATADTKRGDMNRIAEAAPKHWKTLIALRSDDIPKGVADSNRLATLATNTNLCPDDWARFVRYIARQEGISYGALKDEIGDVSKALHAEFWHTFIQVLAEDFQNKGKAYGEFSLMLQLGTSAKLDRVLDLLEQQAANAQSTQPATRLWNVPPNNVHFSGREAVLKDLHDALESHPRVALRGISGVGKTEVAIEYAHRQRKADKNKALFYVLADSRSNLESGFAAIATDLLKLVPPEEQKRSVAVAATKQWFDSEDGWLLILDNADDFSFVSDFLPSNTDGRVLLTTQDSAVIDIARGVPVGKMGGEEGACFLLRRAGRLGEGDGLEKADAEDRRAAEALNAKDLLDGLPLALEQAGAYIQASGTPAEYLELYKNEGPALRKRIVKKIGSRSKEQKTVATTFSLALSKITELRSGDDENVIAVKCAAEDLLKLCAFLAPDAIPEEILVEGAPDLGDYLGPVASNKLLLQDAFSEASRYSLLHRDGGTRTLSVHRLVQVVLQDGMDADMRRLWAERAVRAVNRACPDPAVYSNWPAHDRLLPHGRE